MPRLPYTTITSICANVGAQKTLASRDAIARHTISKWKDKEDTVYEIEIWCWNGKTSKMCWSKVHPTGGTPYRFETEAEARRVLDMCYPDVMSEHKRVVSAV